MKTAIIFLAVVSCTFALSCYKGAGISESAKLTEKDDCKSGVTKCMAPKAGVDNNDFMDYGCGECTDKAKCAECEAENCNAFVAATYALKCYSTNTTSSDCTGLSTKGCYTVKANYKGEHASLKDKFGGCGKCDDTKITPALNAEELKFCTSCEGAECNKPKASSASKATITGLGLLIAVWFSL